MAERINVRHAGRNVDFSELLPAQAALNVIPVSIRGFLLEDFSVPPTEVPCFELATHHVGLVRGSPPCFMHWTESGRAQRGRFEPGALFVRSPAKSSHERA